MSFSRTPQKAVRDGMTSLAEAVGLLTNRLLERYKPVRATVRVSDISHNPRAVSESLSQFQFIRRVRCVPAANGQMELVLDMRAATVPELEGYLNSVSFEIRRWVPLRNLVVAVVDVHRPRLLDWLYVAGYVFTLLTLTSFVLSLWGTIRLDPVVAGVCVCVGAGVTLGLSVECRAWKRVAARSIVPHLPSS
jgi:hypothetical protein